MDDNAVEDAALIAKLNDMDLLPNKDELGKNEYISLREYTKRREVFDKLKVDDWIII
jgi:hypothetical protein